MKGGRVGRLSVLRTQHSTSLIEDLVEKGLILGGVGGECDVSNDDAEFGNEIPFVECVIGGFGDDDRRNATVFNGEDECVNFVRDTGIACN